MPGVNPTNEELITAGKQLRILCADVVTPIVSVFDQQLTTYRKSIGGDILAQDGQHRADDASVNATRTLLTWAISLPMKLRTQYEARSRVFLPRRIQLNH